MATLVFFHAHPDDEAIATGGTMMRAAADGHRVVLVTATNGQLDNPVEGVADQGEQLGTLRIAELQRAAQILGVHRVETLAYMDSGMAGEPTNEAPAAFCQVDVDHAAASLAELLAEEGADVLTVYDADGSYGHPDHIQVHRVGVRAAEIAGVERVFESTINRDYFTEMMASMATAAGDGSDADFELPDVATAEQPTFGQPDSVITHAIPVGDFLESKKAAMVAHASQIGPESWFLAMGDEMFAHAFGTEWYTLRGVPSTDQKFTSIWDGL